MAPVRRAVAALLLLLLCAGAWLAPTLVASGVTVSRPVPAAATPSPAAPQDASEVLDPEAASTAPPIRAAAAVLIDATTGAVLYARNPHQRRHPASTTKIMTALLALEYGRWDEPVKVSRAAAATPGSSMGIRAGDTYRLGDLVAGLLIVSGNDAAVALAEHIAGSQEAFAALMNERARQLGMRDSRFRNPHGLTAPGHYTSAYDLALLARAAMERAQFRELVCSRSGSVCESSTGRNVRLHNTNRLLWMYEFAEGVKTGTTSAAGPCLVASASRDGQRLVAVLLDAPRRFSDARALLEWGFETFALRRVVRGGEAVGEVRVVGGTRPAVAAVAAGDLWVVAPRAAWGTGRLAWRTRAPDRVAAPVKRYEPLGSLEVLLDGRAVAGTRLVASERVPADSLVAAAARALIPAVRALFGER